MKQVPPLEFVLVAVGAMLLVAWYCMSSFNLFNLSLSAL